MPRVIGRWPVPDQAGAQQPAYTPDMPRFARILVACLICLAFAASLIWLIERVLA